MKIDPSKIGIDLYFRCLKSIINKRSVKQNCPTIYLLVIDKVQVFYLRMILYLIDDYNVRIINNLETITKNDIVIPTCVKAQTLLYNDKIYDTLDDKILFYNLLADNYRSCLKHVHLIPTYDENYKGENIFKTFIIKPANESGSRNIIRKEGFINDIISSYAKTHQIQDIINIKTKYAVNFVCKDGVILNKICCTTNGVMKPTHYVFGAFGTYTMNIPIYILEFCKTILASLNYNGLMDIVFIEDEKGKVYIMECNPRMSGLVESPLYFKNLIEPYFNVKSTAVNSMVKSCEYDKKVKIYDLAFFLYKYLNVKLGVKD